MLQPPGGVRVDLSLRPPRSRNTSSPGSSPASWRCASMRRGARWGGAPIVFCWGGISIGFTLPCSSSSSSPGCPQFCRSSSQSRARLSSPHGIRRRPSRGDPAGQVCLLQGFDEHSSCSVWVWSAEIAGVVTWADGVASYCIPTTIKCRILIILHSKQHLLVACRPES